MQLLASQRERVEALRQQVQGGALEQLNERAKRLTALQEVSGMLSDCPDLRRAAGSAHRGRCRARPLKTFCAIKPLAVSSTTDFRWWIRKSHLPTLARCARMKGEFWAGQGPLHNHICGVAMRGTPPAGRRPFMLTHGATRAASHSKGVQLSQAMALPVKGEADLQQMMQQRSEAEREVADIKRAKQMRQQEMDQDPSFAAIRTQSQMLRMASKKLEERRHKLERIENRRKALK